MNPFHRQPFAVKVTPALGNLFVLFFSLSCLSASLANTAETVSATTPVTGEVDFQSDVWPILEQRCLNCHNESRSEGDLSFAGSREAVVAGGHTGRSILGPSASASELIRRITSTENGYRMPKQGPPLDQNQIDVLTRWVDQGARWADTSQSDAAAAAEIQNDRHAEPTGLHREQSWIGNSADTLIWFDRVMHDRSFRWMVYLAGGLLVTVIVLFALRRRFGRDWSRISFWQTIAIISLAFLCAATYFHYDAKHKTAVAETLSLRAELLTYTGPDNSTGTIEIPHPMHPPRLGGVYYRGNDERDPRLFNGGFYRTATLEVWLTNQQGTPMEIGDIVDGPLFVDFVIKRAANTTGELFSDHIMAVVGLCGDVEKIDQGPQSDDRYRTAVRNVIAMQPELPGQQWKSRFQIGTDFGVTAPKGNQGDQGDQDASATSGDGSPIQGNLYVVQNTSRPKIHYGIEFKIQIDQDRRIGEGSQLWMGSLYNLNGRVFVPHDGQKILLDRWFDFRPIPEITGPQTDDPKLLGVPEHVGSK